MKIQSLLILSFLLVILSSCKDKVTNDNIIETTTDTRTSDPGDDSTNEPSPFNFDGAKTASDIGQRGFKVHWDTVPEAGSYHVFLVKNGVLEHQKSFNHPKNNSGNTLSSILSANTEYQVIVRMMDKQGRLDQNNVKLLINTTQWPIYSNGKSVLFNGSQSISLGASNKLINNNRYTISLWFKTSTNQSDARIINFHSRSSAQSAVNFNVNGTNIALGFRDSANVYKKLEISFPYFDGKWHHMAATFNGRWHNVYIDGVKEISVEDSFIGLGSHPATIGAYTGIQQGFTGNIDEVSVWRSAIGVKDIQNIWNYGAPFDIRQHKRHGVLRAYYRMGDHISDSETYIKDVFDADFRSTDFYGTPLGLTPSSFVLDTP
jgi:hypothetical protein